MIIDLRHFLTAERPCWTELEKRLDQIEADSCRPLTLEQIKRLHYLYERTAADLASLQTFATEPETRRYLENLVARAYGEIHETREKRRRFAPGSWLCRTFPQTFRRHVRAFWLAVAITLVGCAFGTLALIFDPEAKAVLLPFPHLQDDPAKRVAREEQVMGEQLRGVQATFSGFLMTHNTKVAILTMALGMTWGVGTLILLFYNGVILGAVSVDYIVAGQGKFLVGWLLPHGSFEIPAILIAGQAGLVLAGALIGWGKRDSLARRLRLITGDLVTLIAGVAVLLVWAGIVEAFFSQYHEPVIPYEVKIGFGVIQLALLTLFLSKAGGKEEATRHDHVPN